MKQQRSKKLLALVMALVLALGTFIGVWAEEGVTEIPVTEEIVIPEPAAEQPAEAPAPMEETQTEQPAENPAPVEENQPDQPADEIPADGETPVEGSPIEEPPAEETPVEEAPALKKGLALIIKKADVSKKAESHKATYILSKDALVLAEKIEGNTERVKVQFILNGEKVTGYVEAGAVAFIEGEPDSKYAALAVGSLYEMADYATEVTEEPIAEETVEEPVIEETIEEPVIEEITEEPVTEEPVVEGTVEEPAIEETIEESVTEEDIEGPVVEEIVEGPVVEETVEEPAIAETIEAPVIEEAIEEPVVEEIVEEPVIEEIIDEAVTESTPEVPAAPVVTPGPTPAPVPAEARPNVEVIPVETPAPAEELTPEPTPDPEEMARAGEAGIREYVERCYTVILGRQGEEDGITDWVGKLTSGQMGGAAVVRGFVASREFISKNYSAGQIVTILYKAMLGREPDAAGLNDWVRHMEVGMTSDAIVAGFTLSQEFNDICRRYGIMSGNFTPTEWRDRNYGITAFVYRAYNLVLNRAADPVGQNDWCQKLLTGTMGGADIVIQFLGSQEFLNRDLSADALVDILYNTMLGRNADAAGKADWVNRLKNKQDVSVIVNGFAGSQEFMGICGQYGIDPGTVNAATAPHVHAWDDGIFVSGVYRYTCYTCGAIRDGDDPSVTPSPSPTQSFLREFIIQNANDRFEKDGVQYWAIRDWDPDSNTYIQAGCRADNNDISFMYHVGDEELRSGTQVDLILKADELAKLPIRFAYYANDDSEGKGETVTAYVEWYGEGEMDKSTYTKNTSIAFTFSESYTGPESDANDLANTGLKIAMLAWDSFLYEKAGVTLPDLGFTSYR